MSYHHSNRSSKSEDFNYPRVQSPSLDYATHYYSQQNLEPLYENNFRNSVEVKGDKMDYVDIADEKRVDSQNSSGWVPPKEFTMGKSDAKRSNKDYPLVKRESIIRYDTHVNPTHLPTSDLNQDYSTLQTPYSYQNGYWGTLFLIHLLAYMIYSYYSSAIVDVRGMDSAYGQLLGTKATILTYLVAISGAIVFNCFLCLVCLVVPRMYVYFVFLLMPVASLAACIIFFVKSAWLSGSIFLIAIVVWILLYAKLRVKMDFTISLLNHTQSFLLSQKTLIIFGIVVQIIAWIYLFSWVNSVFTVFYRYDTVVQCSAWRLPIEPCSVSNWGTFFIVMMVLSLLWTAATFKGCVHMITSSVYTIHHFFPNNKNSNFFFCMTRALTTHLGIAATNAIFTPPVTLIKAIISMFTTNFPTFITRVVRRYNDIGLTYSLIHDNDYTTSNILGYDEMDHTGVLNMMDDSLVSTLVKLSTLLVGTISTLLGYLSLIITNPPFNEGQTYTFGISCGYFLVGSITHLWMLQILQGCNNAFFVCLASDPNSININNPEMINRLNTK